MAKTESTAVNNLIDLVNSNQRSSKSIVHPDDDLFAGPGPTTPIKKMKTPAQPLPTVNPLRMTATLPAMRGATVPPLPRTRSAGGTSQLIVPSQARMSTAPPARGTTIPPIPQRGSAPVFPPKSRMSQPTFTPVVAHGTPAPERVNVQPPLPAATKPSAPELVKSSTGPVNGAFAAVPPLTYPVQHRAPSPQHLARIDMTGDAVLGENWFESSRAVEKFEDETYVGTSPHVLQDRVRESSLVKKLILPAIGFMIVGAMIGGFIAFNSDKKHIVAARPGARATEPALASAKPSAANAARAANEQPRPAIAESAQVAAVEPAPAATNTAAVEPAPAAATNVAIHEIQTTRGVIHLADVRIDSKPSGASVTLVEGSKKSFLGTTPLATSLDTSHTYDLEISLAGRPDQTAHLDPVHTQHLSIELAQAVQAAHVETHVAKKVAVTAPKTHHVAATKSAPTDAIADPGFDSKPVAVASEKPRVATGTGTLMISSKPPCEILIDGNATGMSTPQRAMSLPAGAHKITLVNAGANISKTVMVQINADQATKLVKDLLAN